MPNLILLADEPLDRPGERDRWISPIGRSISTLRHKLLAVDADAKLGTQRSVDTTIKFPRSYAVYAAMDQVAHCRAR